MRYIWKNRYWKVPSKMTLILILIDPLTFPFSSKRKIQAVEMRNRSRLHPIYSIIRTWGSLSIGTRGQYKMGTKGLLCSGISI